MRHSEQREESKSKMLQWVSRMILLACLALPLSALAQDDFRKGITNLQGQLNKDGLVTANQGGAVSKATDTIVFIIMFLLGTVALLTMLALVWGALMYILSGAFAGGEKKPQKAKKIMLYAIVGFILTLLAFFIIQLTQYAITGK